MLLIGLCAPLVTMHGQPALNFKRIGVNWPTIELYFSASCDSTLDFTVSAQDFRVFENNVEVPNFQLWCPDPTVRSSFSVALVFDASGSMMGAGNAAAKQAGHGFIDLMDGVVDEASIIWFTHVVTVYQQMTSNKPMLHSAVDALPASGGTAVWDGGYAGLIELINNGLNPVRAVILMTDGGDNSSSRQPAEIIALANRHRIRVFTIGLGSSINSVELELIALLTGGRYYYVPTASQLVGAYVEIGTLLAQHFQECMITYDAQCADGGLRNVELQLRDYCNGSDTKTKSFRAPLDSTTFSPLHLDLGEVFARHGDDFTLPLNLRTSIHGNNFYPLRYTLTYDTSIIQFKSVTAPPGSLLDGVPITATPVTGGVTIESTAPVLVNGYGRLMNLAFSTQQRSDTLCRDIRPINAGFSQGCFIPIMDTGRVCLSPTLPTISCSVTAPPRLDWRQDSKEYQQNPFTITGRFDNTGDATAANARFRILYDADDIELLSPSTDTQTPSPPHIDPGMFATVSWQVAAKPRTSEDTIELCIRGSFDYHPDVTCCVRIVVSQAGTVLSCAVSVPQIVADTAAVRYTPMPFPLSVAVTNNGGTQSDTVWTSLQLPPEFELAPSETPGNYTKQLLPATLAPRQSGGVNWMLQHPIISSEKSYTLTARSWAAGQDTTVCTVNVRIPGLPPPTFSTRLTASGPLEICQGDSVILDAGSGYLTYNWSHGQQTQQIAVKNAGSYFCVVRRSDGLIGRSDTLHVSVRPAPKPMITPGGTLWFCVGDSVVLGVDGSYEEYLWNIGATTAELVVRIEGKYFVRVRDSHGCWGQSDPVTVISFLKPDKPVIRRTGDVLSVPEGYRCQWFRNGVEIPGATQPALLVTQPGSYQVRVTSSRGCSVVSDIYDVTVLGVAGNPPLAGAPTLHAWPEPASDVLRIRINDIGTQPFTLYLFDVLGRSEVIHEARSTDERGEFQYSLSGRKAGVYYFVAVLPETVLVKRITKL
ncbi:MAG: VWA domain-containing protein [Bacteroidia bacterium]|nr:VWA domain-containing protein [Bacteroidia bacterium]